MEKIMMAQKRITELAETALSQLDSLGYKLDAIGLENQINRHNLIAFLMFGKKRIEGEMDSLNTRIGSNKAKVDGLVLSAEKYIVSAANLATFPAKYTFDRVKAQF